MEENQPQPSSSPDRREALTCALCGEIYREPMLLPCSHTFCLCCLSKIVNKTTSATAEEIRIPREPSSSSIQTDDAVNPDSSTEAPELKSFPCPTCGTGVAIPEDGFAAFPINVDIVQETLRLNFTVDDSICREHPGKAMTMFCYDCQVIICRECKIDCHIHHKSEDVEKTAEKVKSELSNKKFRFQSIHDNLVTIVKKRSLDLDEYEQKRDVVRREIFQRYNRIKTLAKQHRDDALAALQTCDNGVGHKLKEELDDVRQNLKEAHYLYQRIEEAESKGKPCSIVTVSKEMTSGSGSEAAVKKLTRIGHLDEACRPVHRSVLPDDDVMFQTMKTFIGTCEVVTLPRLEEQEPCLVGKEEFQCGDHDDVTVFSLKAESNNDFNVSFDPFYHNKLPPAKCYQQQKCNFTILINTDDKRQLGRKSFALLDGRLSFRNTSYLSFYCKGCWNNATYALNNKNNLCVLERTKFVSSKVSDKELFTIQSKSCRALDVDSSQQYFVVVEEGENPTIQRKVLLYRRPETNITVKAVDTYISPITPFQPADVCFYTPIGQTDSEILLIADEANDVLHVAEVKDDRVTFIRFLCPGCPLLLQPTALNTDHEGRLWVGCRGGRILIFHREVEYNMLNMGEWEYLHVKYI